jgi:hypothetical protein
LGHYDLPTKEIEGYKVYEFSGKTETEGVVLREKRGFAVYMFILK